MLKRELIKPEDLTDEQKQAMKPYQIGYDLDKNPVWKYKYMLGRPKQVRFDAKDGTFNFNGDKKTSFDKLVFQPIAWRIFKDNILGMGMKQWCEIFYVDEQNCVCAILFHGFSVDNLFAIAERLYYDERTLADVVLTCEPSRHVNEKITPKSVYYIAEFSYDFAKEEDVELKELFSTEVAIYRADTLTDVANIQIAHNFYNPYSSDWMNGDTGTYEPALRGEKQEALPEGRNE